jgi:hypothetical protein
MSLGREPGSTSTCREARAPMSTLEVPFRHVGRGSRIERRKALEELNNSCLKELVGIPNLEEDMARRSILGGS